MNYKAFRLAVIGAAACGIGVVTGDILMPYGFKYWQQDILFPVIWGCAVYGFYAFVLRVK